MRSVLKGLLGAVLLVGVTACATSPEELRAQELAAFQAVQADAERDIRKVLNEQDAAWNAGDIDGFMSTYWNSEELRFASGDTITWGWQASLDRYKSKYDTPQKMGKLSTEIQEIKVFSDNDAMVFGRWYLTREGIDDAGGVFTLIFEKIDGNWLIVSDHTS